MMVTGTCSPAARPGTLSDSEGYRSRLFVTVCEVTSLQTASCMSLSLLMVPYNVPVCCLLLARSRFSYICRNY
jgi:hypothetical protein